MKKLGFTLAEVLITLVIIGVIAAMTVPTLMNNTNAQEFRSSLKKALSAVNQALTLHYALTSETAQDFTSASALTTEVFKTRMSLMEATNSDATSQGWNTNEFTLNVGDGCGNGTTNKSANSTFVSADGIMYCIDNEVYFSSNADNEGTSCDRYNSTPCVKYDNNHLTGANTDKVRAAKKPNLWIDVNGAKRPNQITTSAKRPRDIYQAVIYSQKVIPYGKPTQEVMYEVGTSGATDK